MAVDHSRRTNADKISMLCDGTSQNTRTLSGTTVVSISHVEWNDTSPRRHFAKIRLSHVHLRLSFTYVYLEGFDLELKVGFGALWRLELSVEHNLNVRHGGTKKKKSGEGHFIIQLK